MKCKGLLLSSLFNVFMRTIAFMLLLIAGTATSCAQYYMNVFNKNGETVRFAVTELDSVFFTYKEIPAYEYVDLGLSVKWAAFNVGATKPEEFGDYFAWGETKPKEDYSWPAYKWCNGSYDSLTKYNTKSDYGTVDDMTVLDPEDDVAHVRWGGSWRMPTKAEQEELLDSCTWTWFDSGNTEFNGVAGCKVTSNVEGYTDRSIFLPASGYRESLLLGGVGYYGYYMSSLCSGSPYFARVLELSSDSRRIYYAFRCNGQSVRPVCP